VDAGFDGFNGAAAADAEVTAKAHAVTSTTADHIRLHLRQNHDQPRYFI
jgi:hypothetical protein